MSTTLEYLAEKHQCVVRNGYKTSDGTRFERCVEISEELAARLSEEGRKPHFFLIHKEEHVMGGIYDQPFTPILFQNTEIVWYSHRVCCCDGMVFDPLFKDPVPLQDYCRLAFGREDLEMIAVPVGRRKE